MENIRIDKGLKRGKRRPRPTIKSRDPISGRAFPVIPKDLDPATVLARYLTNERTAEIAASFNVTRPALNMWLLDTAEEGWRKAQIARAVSRKEDAEDEIEDARDPLTLARAREKLRSAQWELERLYSRLFGQKQEVTIKDATDLGDRLRRARERVIEGEATVAPTPKVIDVAPLHSTESATPPEAA